MMWSVVFSCALPGAVRGLTLLHQPAGKRIRTGELISLAGGPNDDATIPALPWAGAFQGARLKHSTPALEGR